MKKTLLILALVFWGIAAQATGQSFVIEKYQTEQSVFLGDRVETHISVKNTSAKDIFIKVEKTANALIHDQSSYFKLGDKICGVRKGLSENAVLIKPGESKSILTAYLISGFTKGESEVAYRLFDERAPSESHKIVLKYKTMGQTDSDKMLVNRQINISNLYPNPASSFIAFDYVLSEDVKDARIAILNVLGTQVSEHKLNFYQTDLKIPLDGLKPGIYFFSLYVDNLNLVTKKFIVKR